MKDNRLDISIISPDYIRNNKNLISIYLNANTGNIGVIGEELLREELSYGKNIKGNFRSDILKKAMNAERITILKESSNRLKNVPEFIIKYLDTKDDNVDLNFIIGKKLLYKELQKFDNKRESIVIQKILENCKTFDRNIPESLRNNFEFCERFFEKEEFESRWFGYVGEDVFKEIYEKYFFDGRPYIVEFDHEKHIKNNEMIMKKSVQYDINSFNYIGEELLDSELKKPHSDIIELVRNDETFALTPDSDINSNIEICEMALRNDINSLNYVSGAVYLYYFQNKNSKDKMLNELRKRHFSLSENSIMSLEMECIDISLDHNINTFKYIDFLLIKSELKRLMRNIDSDLFLMLAKKLNISDYNKFRDEIIQMYKKNNSLFSTLEVELLSDEYSGIRDELPRISVYPEIQKKILNLQENNLYDVFEQIFKVISNGNSDYIDIVNKILNTMNDQCEMFGYEELNKNISQEKLTSSEIEKIAYLYTMPNYFNIKSLEDIKNYELIKNEIFEEIIRNPNTDKIVDYPAIFQLKPIDRVKFVIFQKKFGIGMEDAKNLIDFYSEVFSDNELEGLTADEIKIKEQIINLKKIISINDINVLQKIDEKIKIEDFQYISYRKQTSIMRKFITRKYNEKLFSLQNKEVSSEVYCDGKKIQVFEAGTNFNMLIHAFEAFSKKRQDEYDGNFYENWNRPKMRYHSFCTSFISNDMIGTANTDSIILGFDNIKEGTFLASAPWDIYSADANKSFDAIEKLEKSGTINLCLPEYQKNQTRYFYNETVLERNVLQNGKLEKVQPDYIVYITDSYNPNIEYDNNEKWAQTKMAAKQFNVPIVIVDRCLCAENELRKINDLIRNGKENDDICLLIKALEKIQNNIAGCRKYHENIRKKYFSEEKVNEILDEIILFLEKDIDKDLYKHRKNWFEVMRFERREQKKWELAREPDFSDMGYNHKEFTIRLQELSAYYMKMSSEYIVEVPFDNKLDVILENAILMGDLKDEHIVIEALENLDKFDLRNHIKQIKKSGGYQDKENFYSREHIQNVMLFATMIGNDKLNDEEMKLLIEACKYYDIGRVFDGEKQNSEAATRMTEIMLKDKYSQEQINIIKASIEFIENQNVLTIDEICMKNGVSKNNINTFCKIAFILQDADELDKIRFNDENMIDVQKLKFRKSSDLIKLAYIINELYVLNKSAKIPAYEDIGIESFEKIAEKETKLIDFSIWEEHINNIIMRSEAVENYSEYLPDISIRKGVDGR